jgi:hypothetical protein
MSSYFILVYSILHGVHCSRFSDFSVRGAPRRHFFSASGAVLSHEVPAVKGMSNQPAL